MQNEEVWAGTEECEDAEHIRFCVQQLAAQDVATADLASDILLNRLQIARSRFSTCSASMPQSAAEAALLAALLSVLRRAVPGLAGLVAAELAERRAETAVELQRAVRARIDNRAWCIKEDAQ